MKIQLCLWPKQDRFKKYPLKIRITENRKSKYISIGYAIKKEFWNAGKNSVRTTYPNYIFLDNLIQEKLNEAETLAPRHIDIQTNTQLSFIQYFETHIKNLEVGKKIADKKKHSVVLEHLKNFLRATYNREDMMFKEISGELLQQIVYYFEGMKLTKNTQNGYFKKVKHLYYQAINNNLFAPVKNPFDSFDNKTSKPKNKSLTFIEFKGLELFNPYQFLNKGFQINKNIVDISVINELNTLRNIFVFQFYCYGIRVSDLLLLKWDNINNGKIVYRMRKTNKVKTIKLNNFLIEKLRFFLPVDKKIFFLSKRQNILDVELLNSLNLIEKNTLLNNLLKTKKSKYLIEQVETKEKILFKETYYKENNINYETLTNIYNGLSLDPIEKNNYILPFLTDKDKQNILNSNAENSDLIIHHIIQSKTTLYNRALKQLNSFFLDMNGQLIKTTLTSHLPRHSYTSISLSLGLDVFTISESLGHSDIKTTQNYIHTLDNELVDNNISDVFSKFNGSNDAIIQKNKNIIIVNQNKEPVKKIDIEKPLIKKPLQFIS